MQDYMQMPVQFWALDDGRRSLFGTSKYAGLESYGNKRGCGGESGAATTSDEKCREGRRGDFERVSAMFQKYC